MPTLGLSLLVLYGLLAFGVRMVVQLRRTGSSGFKGLHDVSGPVERMGRLLVAMAVVLCVAGPVLQLTDALDPVQTLEGDLANTLGVVLASLGVN